MSSSEKAVVVAGIKKSFGSVAALRDVSFEVERGEVLGLLGPNGAGKTTTVNILSTLIKPDSGRALIAGHDVVSDPAGVRRALMLTGQHAALGQFLESQQGGGHDERLGHRGVGDLLGVERDQLGDDEGLVLGHGLPWCPRCRRPVGCGGSQVVKGGGRRSCGR